MAQAEHRVLSDSFCPLRPPKRGERKGPHAKRGGGEVGRCHTIDTRHWMKVDLLWGNNHMTHLS